MLIIVSKVVYRAIICIVKKCMVFTEDSFSTTYCFTKYAVSKLCQIIIDGKSLCNSSRVRKRDVAVAYYTYYVSNLLLKVKQKIDWYTYLNLYENNDNRAFFPLAINIQKRTFGSYYHRRSAKVA